MKIYPPQFPVQTEKITIPVSRARPSHLKPIRSEWKQSSEVQLFGLIDNMTEARNIVGSQSGKIYLAGNTHKLQTCIPVITECYVMFSLEKTKQKKNQ